MKTYAALLAPAKLNIHLHVLGRKGDGYHDIRTLFQAVSLYDEISCVVERGKNGIVIENGVTGKPEDDLMYKAWEGFSQVSGVSTALRIIMRKGIPVQAGLGGGSSDCAAVLMLLNELCDKPLSEKNLHFLARGLGSDVPFFLGSPAACAEGRGDVLAPAPVVPRYTALIVDMPKPMNTAYAYGLLDAGGLTGGKGPETQEILGAYTAFPPGAWPFFNTFYELYRCEEKYTAVIDTLMALGAEFSSLTGSGSALFGIFTDRRKAEKAYGVLSGEGRVWLTEPLERKPPIVLQ